MTTNLLWFVMAGFLLGFATSTLWEWFYFRKERLKLTDRRIRELEAKLRDAEADTNSNLPTATVATPNIATPPLPTVASVTGSGPRTAAWGEPSYRSPGVFLESEEYEPAGGEVPTVERELTRPQSTSASTTPPSIPNVSSGMPSASQQASPGDSSTGSTSDMLPDSARSDLSRTEPSRTEPSRSDQLTPADALRAKRSAVPRSRQEVLAALRRNSEAMQRGQFPPPSDDDNVAPPPVMPRPNTLVTPTVPESQEPPQLATSLPVQESSAAQPAQSPARSRWVNDPGLTARTTEYPDDLSKIRGIGDVYKQRLYRAGIYTWKQIAEADTEVLRRATSAYPSSNVEEWLVQAEKLMEKHGRRNAVYSGPQPDDMTKILGIGPVSASVLYRAGICTYEQLASIPVSELEVLFPIAVAGDLPDFAQWVARAAELADEKHAAT